MRLQEIETHLASMDELRDVVGAMRSLASMRIQESLHALPGIRRYADAMAKAIGAVLLLLPEGPRDGRRLVGHRALVLYTAEHGFVGGFNERLIAAATIGLDRDDALFILGSRGAALAQERGLQDAWTRPMATRSASVPDIVRRLSVELYDRIARGAVTRVDVMFSRHRQGNAPTIERRPLFPLDFASFAPEPRRLSPLHNLPPQALIEKLAAEYIFALLTEAGTESLASENAARFSAMESAHDSVSKKLEQLQRDAQQARQDEITTELMDLVTGAEAVRAI